MQATINACVTDTPTTLFNSVAIRDTGFYTSSPLKSNGLPFKGIKISNTLDQPIEIVLEISRDGGSTWQYGSQIASAHTAGVTLVYGRSKEALQIPWPDFRFRIKATAAPTSGSVEGWMIQHAN